MIQTLADALAERGYDTLTPVQEAVSDPELATSDLLVSAQTGSGKTVGFGLAIAPTLLGEAPGFDAPGKPLALVIAPTRELALQVRRELGWLYAKAGAVMASCVGGMDMRDERRALERGAHIVVATPGRLRDHLSRGSIDLSELRAVILDEADEMLDLGFREDLEFILGEAPATRRTLMFSATVPRAIAALAETYMQDPERIELRTSGEAHADIAYHAMTVAPQDAENAIINVLRFHEARNALVFANTRAVVNRLTARLSNRGFAVVALSGELTQSERANALQAMRDGRARVCVATDVAARGIDLPGLELVIHAEIPSNADTLLHRSGRTGRAGAKGVSALIVPPKMRSKAQRLLGFAKLKATWGPAPSAEAVLAQDENRFLEDTIWEGETSEGETPMVERLLAAQDARALATACVRLWRAGHAAPEDLADANAPQPERAPRPPFGPSGWVAISAGHQQRAEARWLLPLICNAGGIDKNAIGAIRVGQTQTFVEIALDKLPQLLAAVGESGSIGNDLSMSPVEGPPVFEPRPVRPVRADRPARAQTVEPTQAPPSEPTSVQAPTQYRRDTDVPTDAPEEVPTPIAEERPRKPRHKAQPAGTGAKPWAKPDGARPAKPYGKRPEGERPAKPWAKREDGERPAKPYAKRPEGDRPAKPWAKREDGERPAKPYAKRPDGDRTAKPWAKREDSERPAKPYAKWPEGDRPAKPWAKREDSERPAKPYAKRPEGDRPAKPWAKREEGERPAKPRADASDTSKRFVPPGGKPSAPRAGKPGAKPFGKPGGKPPARGPGKPPRGGDAPMRKRRDPS